MCIFTRLILIIFLSLECLQAETMLLMQINDLNKQKIPLTDRQLKAKQQQYFYDSIDITDTKITITKDLSASDYFYQKTILNEVKEKVDVYTAESPLFSPFKMQVLFVVHSTDNNQSYRQIVLSHPYLSKDNVYSIRFMIIEDWNE